MNSAQTIIHLPRAGRFKQPRQQLTSTRWHWAGTGSRLRFIPAIIAFWISQATAHAVTLSPQELALACQLVRDHGQQRSRSQMQLDPVLTAVARSRAQDMATRRYFSHVTPDGYGPNQITRAAGYCLPSSWGTGRSDNYVESIGAGYRTAEDAWQAWMSSRCHKTHLLAAQSFYRSQTRFGIGYYFDPASPYRRYWVVITAPPAQEPSVSPSFEFDPASKIQIGVQVPVSHNSGKAVAAKVARPATHPLSAPRPTRIARTATPVGLWNWESSGERRRTGESSRGNSAR